MDKKEEFKKFVSSKPELINIVRNKKHSWQDLYEVYDLYGTDEEAWRKYIDNIEIKDTKLSAKSLGELTKLIKNVNMDNVQKYIDTAQKAIGIVQELTKGSAIGAVSKLGPKEARPINKIFED